MQRIIYDNNGGARCGNCRRLLYKCLGGERPAGVEIKCHSCKEINISEYRFCRNCRWYQMGACCMGGGCFETTETDYCDQWEGGGSK